MSKYPRVQQKIKTELRVDNRSEDLTLDRIDSLVYLDSVINEVVRFCICVSGTVRIVYIDDCLPKSSAQSSKGTQIFIPFYNLARDSRLCSIDPGVFYPERFINEDKDHHLHALIPFGGGHRACVGQDLSRFELEVIIARLMQYVTVGDGGPQINSGGFISVITENHEILVLQLNLIDFFLNSFLNASCILFCSIESIGNHYKICMKKV
jgi:cytochrome P450